MTQGVPTAPFLVEADPSPRLVHVSQPSPEPDSTEGTMSRGALQTPAVNSSRSPVHGSFAFSRKIVARKYHTLGKLTEFSDVFLEVIGSETTLPIR